MRKLTQREKVLLSVMAVGGLFWVWFVSQKAVSDVNPHNPDEAETPGLAAGAPRVDLGLLAQGGEAYDPQGRDLFKYSKKPPTAEELEALRRQREEAERLARLRAEAEAARLAQQREVAEQRQAAAPPPVDRGPRPPRIQFSYIGYLGPKDDRIAVFSQGEDVLLARAGEVVEDRFRVVEIRFESVLMGFTDPQFEDDTHELAVSVGGRR